MGAPQDHNVVLGPNIQARVQPKRRKSDRNIIYFLWSGLGLLALYRQVRAVNETKVWETGPRKKAKCSPMQACFGLTSGWLGPEHSYHKLELLDMQPYSQQFLGYKVSRGQWRCRLFLFWPVGVRWTASIEISRLIMPGLALPMGNPGSAGI